MHTSQAGRKLIARNEGCVLKAYLDTGGVPTIGYGHTHGVKLGQVITNDQADAFLAEDLLEAENGVLAALQPTRQETLLRKAYREPTQAQFDAMVSLTYNIGVRAFSKSTVRNRYVAGDFTAAANAFSMWIKDNGRVLPGLVKRRSEEKAMFLSSVSPDTHERQTVEAAVSVPESSIKPNGAGNDTPFLKTKELWGGVSMAAASVTNYVSNMTVDSATDLKTSVGDIPNQINPHLSAKLHIGEVTSAIGLALGVFIIYKRFIHKRDGVR